MAITWSRLHEVLGLGPRALTYADVEQAVTLQVDEDSRLEWKERRTDESARDELGKDVAAMANSGGGVIVFGVGEEGQDKHKVLKDVDLAEQAEQQIRSVVWGRVRPLIPGVEVLPLENPAHPQHGVLVVAVPPSPDAPHFYEKNGQPPTAPWRNGPHTESLREHEIERAYRDRFARRDAATAALTALLASGSRMLRFGDSASRAARWCVVVSHPLTSVPVGAPATTADQAREAVKVAARAERTLLRVSPGASWSAMLEELDLNPRVGLRRWVIRPRLASGTDDGKSDDAYAELHHDGSALFAFPVGEQVGAPDGTSRPALIAAHVERTTVAAITLTRAWHEARSIAGTTIMRAAVVTDPRDNRPLWVWGPEAEARGFSGTGIPTWTRPVAAIEPVDAVLDARPTTNNDRATAIAVRSRCAASRSA